MKKSKEEINKEIWNYAHSKDWHDTPEYKKFLEYKEKVKDSSLLAPGGFGFPRKKVIEHGGIIAVYDECIAKGVSWEELLGMTKWGTPPDGYAIP